MNSDKWGYIRKGWKEMRELRLIAVGSDALIADEIKAITESFMEGAVEITTMTTAEVRDVESGALYICATTQREALSRIVPGERLFVFDLHPMEDFFTAISKIPEAADIYVFNNHQAYTNLLVRECAARGMGNRQFHAISFQEQPRREVIHMLRKARYIVGVDRMMGSQTLFSEKYRFCLRNDVKIIAGRRAASAASAGRLLTGIAEHYEREMHRERQMLKLQLEKGRLEDLQERIEKLLARIFEVACMLANAHFHIMSSEGQDMGDDELFLDDSESVPTGDCAEDIRMLGRRLRDFELLRQRLQMLVDVA